MQTARPEVILDDIVANTRAEVERREGRTPLENVCARAQKAPAVRKPDFRPVSLIAEVKRRSPSAGTLAEAVDPVAQARAYESAGAAAISVLADEKFFGGSLDDLASVRAAVSIPVLCKDFILTPYQVWEARAYDADLLLLIVAALDDADLHDLLALTREIGMTPLVEVHDQHDLARAIAAEADLIGINNRDLTDFSVDLVTTEYLAPLVPDGTTIVSESGIATQDDVRRVVAAGATAILVGETLMRSSDPAGTIAELLS